MLFASLFPPREISQIRSNSPNKIARSLERLHILSLERKNTQRHLRDAILRSALRREAAAENHGHSFGRFPFGRIAENSKEAERRIPQLEHREIGRARRGIIVAGCVCVRMGVGACVPGANRPALGREIPEIQWKLNCVPTFPTFGV